MAQGFKIAADYVIDSCLANPRHPDIFFYPAAYLYRHYIELQLKVIIARGRHLLENPPTKKQMYGHRLRDLWRIAKRILNQVWPDGNPSELDIVDSAIAEFSALDCDGQGFRYYTNPQGQRNLENAPRIISLSNLKKLMNEVYELLSACECGLGEYVSAQAEYEQESI